MAKIPSRKFPNSKKKIAGKKFPKGKRKIASKKLGKRTTEVDDRKTIAASKASTTKSDASVVPSILIDEKSRPERLAALMKQSKSLKPASELPRKADQARVADVP